MELDKRVAIKFIIATSAQNSNDNDDDDGDIIIT